jgi:hypothetical protein
MTEPIRPDATTLVTPRAAGAAGTERLAALAKDAEAKGFRLIAREASSAPR